MRDCPNKITLLVNHLGQYESESESVNEINEYENVVNNPIFDDDDDGIEFEHGESLIVRRTLNVQSGP